VRYPLFLDLTDRRVVVVGGGAVAVRRTADLLEAGARVTVVAPDIDPAIASRPVEVRRREFQPADLDDCWLALALTDVAAVNTAVVEAAAERGVWCVRADDAAHSPAWRPAVTQVDDLTVAVSANADPGRAVAIRNAVEAKLREGELYARRSRPAGRRVGGGRVVLVGGGPGDPDLLTLRGFRALLDADVVVTDRLAPTRLLELLPAGVEVVDVGKTPGGEAAAQEAINELIVARAQQGEIVVRLKGGDPFVLGRGSEEVDACVRAGVVVDVVPGLTSAVAAATLAGVPLTERGTTQHFTVVSGHVPPGDPRSSVDWGLLAATDATLVLLMAVANLGRIAAALIAGGRMPSTPVAVIESASLPQQRVVTSMLGDLAATAEAAQIVPPAVVVIGDVVRT
jgi:uroporphyrin-III C-methyltransferase / precorrin-2 dehydrogenase / sirohydrochlorin ferrochelatase